MTPNEEQNVSKDRVLAWFSCGAASAVAAKKAIEKYGDRVEVLYCDTLKFEHPDNRRFLAQVEKWLGVQIKLLRSFEYEDVDDVFRKRRYVAGVGGAACTKFLKRDVRKAYERLGDIHIFGLTADEKKRIREFEERNSIWCEWLLMEQNITKQDCFKIIAEAGIELPAMYHLGYPNNNCIGCVKGGMGYWNKIRRDFPERFKEVATLTREIGARLLKRKINGKDVRYFLDELQEDWGDPMADEPSFDCGVQCEMPAAQEDIYDGRFTGEAL